MSHISPSNVQKHVDIIVIGAGISGLACASRLHQKLAAQGDTRNRICILEARDRIGGRIGAVHVNGCRLDIGANWIHGIGTEDEPNPLMNILPHKRYKELSGMVTFRPPRNQTQSKISDPNVHTDQDDWEHVHKNIQSEPANGPEDLVIPSGSASIITKTLWTTIGTLHKVAFGTPAAEANRTTMLSALTKSDVFRTAFKELSPEYHTALSGLPQFLEPMEAAPLVAQSAEHGQDSSAMSLAEFAIDDFDGAQVFLQDGYIAIIEELATPLIDAGLVQTGVEVNQIDWTQTPISLKTSLGTYTADTVVCTLPLGVLKHRQQQEKALTPLFEPMLPYEKTKAISSLGFGTLDKIFMVYDNPWWNEEPFASILAKGFSRRPSFSRIQNEASKTERDRSRELDSFAGFTHELPGLSISEDGKVSTGPRLLSIVNLHSLCGFPVLSAFVSCANAVHVESLPNADAGALIHRSLNSWFGQDTPAPDAVHVTRWAQDPHCYGSYSHMITGLSKIEHREEFQKPLSLKGGGTLRFAGEHTSKNHFATAHGGLLSGWREADDILMRESQ